MGTGGEIHREGWFPKPHAQANGCSVRERGVLVNAWRLVGSMHFSVCVLLKVLVLGKAENFEKIDKSLVITRNYFHALITLLNMENNCI